MAIQNRRGKFGKFDPARMVPGEWAVVLDEDPSARDGRSVYICFAAGSVKRMATYEDMVENVSNSIVDISERLTAMVEATDAGIKASEKVRTAAEKARESAETARAAAEIARVELLEGARPPPRPPASGPRRLSVAAETTRAASEQSRAGQPRPPARRPRRPARRRSRAGTAPRRPGRPPRRPGRPPRPGASRPTDSASNASSRTTRTSAGTTRGRVKALAPATTGDIDEILAGRPVEGSRVIDTAALAYLWPKIVEWGTTSFAPAKTV